MENPSAEATPTEEKIPVAESITVKRFAKTYDELLVMVDKEGKNTTVTCEKILRTGVKIQESLATSLNSTFSTASVGQQKMFVEAGTVKAGAKVSVK